MMKRKRLLMALGGVVLLIGGGAYAATRGGSASTMTTETVKRTDVVQTVEVTGTVETESDVELSFGTSGVVRMVSVKVGDAVRSGQVLAVLNAGTLQASYAQALEGLNEAKATLAEKEAGISDEDTGVSQADIAVAEAALAAAEQDVERVKTETTVNAQQAKEDVVDALRSLVTEIRQALASADTVLGVENPLFNRGFDEVLGAEDVNALPAAQAAFERAADSRDTAEAALWALNGTDTTAAAEAAEVAYADAYETLADTSRVLDATSADSDAFSLDDLVAFKSTISAAQSSLVSMGSGLRVARQASANADQAMSLDVADAQTVVDSRKADLARAQASYVSATADPRAVNLAAYQAAVGQAEANVSAAAARLRDAQIISPITGTVTVREIDPGESASALVPVLTVLSSSDTYAVTLDLPEADVAKVAIGQTAEITFDSLGDDRVFSGTVGAIDPAQTVIQDVVFYSANVFLNADQDLSVIKPGMSANVTILTAQKTNVLTIPSRAVLEKNGVKYVRVPEGDSYVERTVSVGLRADDGLMEIVDGLGEGETIIVSLKTN